MAGWRITDEPSAEPVSLEEVQNFIKQDEEEDNPLLERLITAARKHCERETRRSFIRRTVEATFDEWPISRTDNNYSWPLKSKRQPAFILPKASPLISVSKVQYVDTAGYTQTLSSSVYRIVTTRIPGRIRLAKDQVWPDAAADEDAITVTYDVGYGEDDDVPEDAKVAVLFLVDHWYNHREAVDVSVGGTVTRVPHGFEALINGLKVPRVH